MKVILLSLLCLTLASSSTFSLREAPASDCSKLPEVKDPSFLPMVECLCEKCNSQFDKCQNKAGCQDKLEECGAKCGIDHLDQDCWQGCVGINIFSPTVSTALCGGTNCMGNGKKTPFQIGINLVLDLIEKNGISQE